MGTPWEVETTGTILLLEDTTEELYRIDRMLTQLALGGKLAGVAGVAFGYCTDCPVKGPSLSLEEILTERLATLGVPALKGLAFGHIQKMLTLPIGLPATLDADAGTLHFDEAAVVYTPNRVARRDLPWSGHLIVLYPDCGDGLGGAGGPRARSLVNGWLLTGWPWRRRTE
jgi:hypothetical protein